jgi:hypothetical protein
VLASLPVYSHTEAVTGSVIMLALYVTVLAVMAVGWWRQR